MDVLCDTEGRRVSVGGAIYGDGDDHQLEDDDFYAELVRQVLILTADDDDSAASTPRRRDNVGYFDSMAQPAAATGRLFSSSSYSLPNWPAVNASRNGGGGFGGTGVFIPLTAAKSRRRNGNGNHGRRGGSSHKQQAEKKMVQNKH
ncbi:unnamed protein product [Linum tenue]|uniref:Uncharacterized protein n=1 Tax=Linum tenue TaxID=586396 RepID=A0AAV0R843_9ROSI|nr:unnamed protein product [Linum tenue]